MMTSLCGFVDRATQEFMAARAHATVYNVKASHALLVSHPGATLKVILASESTGSSPTYKTHGRRASDEAGRP